ncbi:MAG: bifunctional 5,10-methylenetetrahydrofolate dehydrogenase/5,10-methenyltetrahydrofolate cyclohydrolase [Candidatus Velamenicoccus archaeovorus]
MAVLMEGRVAVEHLRGLLKDEIASLSARHKRRPELRCIVVGRNAAASVYLKSQAKVAQELGIGHAVVALPEDIRPDDLIGEIAALNNDPSVTGILLQCPLPSGIDLEKAASFILPARDAEGIHPANLGRLVLGEGRIVPCTAQACIELLHHYQVKLYGREAVVVGHSSIVGKPLSLLLLKEFATTTVCHIATAEAHKLEDHVRRAHVLIVAVGKPGVIKGEWIAPGAVVIDVGINKCGESLVGDVEFEAARQKASFITPVPGGVGPLTVMLLMKNICELFKESLKLQS